MSNPDEALLLAAWRLDPAWQALVAGALAGLRQHPEQGRRLYAGAIACNAHLPPLCATAAMQEALRLFDAAQAVRA